MYGMGKQKALPKILDRVHPKRRTPWIAIIITTILSVAFIFADDIRLVASITDFFIFILFVIINMSLIYLRYRSPRLKRGFRVPLNIGKMPVLPVLGIIFSLLLMVSLSYASIFYGIIIIIIGMIAYSLFIHPTKNR
jgi:APA family basic amino acid/polyamine antiporter